MFYILFCTTILIISIILFVLIFVAYKKNVRIPILGDFAKRRYLKARFKIWDDLTILESKKRLSRLRIICFKLHKAEASFYQFLAILFRPEKDSFILLNSDKEPDKCNRKDLPNHKELKKKISIFSMIGLAILIITNILVAFIISQVFPSIFNIKAASTEYTSQADWESGTVSSSLDTTTSPGDIILGASSSAVSITQTSYSDFSGGTLSSVDITTNQGDIVLDTTLVNVWGDDEATTSAAIDQQNNSVLTTDENGGAIIAWEDSRSGGDRHIYAQRMDSSGVAQLSFFFADNCWEKVNI